MQLNRNDSLMSQADDSQRLQLFVSCRNLQNLDIITVTDSFLIVTLQQPNKQPKRILKTKVYLNDLNPNYAQSILIDFIFQIKQKLTFQVFHEANPPKLVGKLQTSVGEIFGSPQHGLVKDIINNSQKKSGKIIIRCQKQQNTQKKQITFKISAKNLPNYKTWWFLGGTCSFFRIIRKRNNDQLLIYQSQTINYSTQPKFKQVKISQRKLNKKQQNKQIQIRFYNYSNMGNHQQIGKAVFSMKMLNDNEKSFKLLNQNKKQSGMVIFEQINISFQYSFMDYINNNLQLSLIQCIDFTASNGTPTLKQSLHYYDNNTKSVYERALTQVTSILMDYDYDKLVPVYGFGAKVNHPLLKSNNKVHHCFPINGNIGNPSLYGIQQIIQNYRNMLKYIQLSGPTLFAALLKQAIQQAKQYQKNHNQYMILFIITDGQIHDKDQVIDLIIQCNRLPISIIIVGVGNGDFGIMQQLDDDDQQMVSSNGKKNQRDLVQFVQFKKFNNNPIELARQVLQQLPRQVSEYYQLIKLTPNDIKNKSKNQNNDIDRVLKQAEIKYVLKQYKQQNPYY